MPSRYMGHVTHTTENITKPTFHQNRSQTWCKVTKSNLTHKQFNFTFHDHGTQFY